MSKNGVYKQLTSEFEGFKKEDVDAIINKLDDIVDFNASALNKAKQYQETQQMSADAIRNQLTSEFEGFTQEQTDYAINNLNK